MMSRKVGGFNGIVKRHCAKLSCGYNLNTRSLSTLLGELIGLSYAFSFLSISGSTRSLIRVGKEYDIVPF
jgi:hypothetical protein